jgi:hypothetical protein
MDGIDIARALDDAVFLPQEALPFPGRLALASAVATSTAYLVSVHGARYVASLMRDDEYGDGAGHRAWAERSGIGYDTFPVDPGEAPGDDAFELFVGFAAHALERLRAGETVALQSRSGRGRCGLAAATILVLAGVPASDALASVEAVRPGATAHEAQRAFVFRVAAGAGVGTEVADRVDAALTAAGWRYGRSDQAGVASFTMPVSGTNGHHAVLIKANDRIGLANVMVRLPVRVPLERRHAVSGLVCHLNHRRILGAFELDLRSGDVAFRADLQVVDGTLGREAVARTLDEALSTSDASLPLVSRVAFGGEAPETVLSLDDGSE